MTEQNHQEVLAQQKAWLVERGDAVGKAAGGVGDWKNQIGVLQAAAAKETEPLVMLNLLRYQRARKKGSWTDSFQPLEAAMEQCRDIASGNAELAMLLIRHLLLYTSRAYTYEKEFRTEKPDTSSQQEEA